jgi:hypothetical protein
MVDAEVLVKTTAGLQEITARSRRLPPRLRSVLIMADGQLTAAELREAATKFGACDAVASLLEQGMLAPRSGSLKKSAGTSALVACAVPEDSEQAKPAALTDGERFRAALKYMNDSAVQSLGLRAFFFTLKLEKCFTADDLYALLPDYKKVIAKGSGPEVAGVLEERARQLIYA